MSPDELPPWAFELCPACGRDVALDLHLLVLSGHSPLPLVALAWLCDVCDLVLRSAGLFTDLPAARRAFHDELDFRAAGYAAASSDTDAVTTEFRRCSLE